MPSYIDSCSELHELNFTDIYSLLSALLDVGRSCYAAEGIWDATWSY